jgi:hypothetical protein
MLKKIIGLAVISACVLGAYGFQAYAINQFQSAIKDRLGKIEYDTGLKLSNVIQKTEFDFFSLSVVNTGVQVQFGDNPVIATINSDNVSYSLFKDQLVFKEFDVLSILSTGGAVSLISIDEVSVDVISPSKVNTGGKISFVGVNLSDKVFLEFLTSSYSDDILSLLSKKPFDASITTEVLDNENVKQVYLEFDMPEVARLQLGAKYQELQGSLAEKSLDPDTGLPFEFDKVVSDVKVYDFSIELEDKGVRESSYRLAALNLDQPSIDDIDTFRNKVVTAYDSYVSQVAINPMLPFDSMHAFTSFLSEGETFFTKVTFTEPAPYGLVFSHLLGMPVPDIYKNVVVDSEK